MSALHSVLTTATDVLAALPGAVPDPDPVQPPGTEGLTTVMGWAKWVALAVCVLGLFAAGALMAIQSRRGEGGEHVGKIGMALGGVVVISAGAALVGFLAT
jgi:peptidoglycan/LPS O-acetylase OafA/YrhL